MNRTEVMSAAGAARGPTIDWGAARQAPPHPDALPAPMVVCIGLLCALGGISVAVGGLKAVALALAVICCLLILYDFRIGVVMLLLAFPISHWERFPHAMFGITGLNPMNLLVFGTLASALFHASTDRRLPHLMPRQLVFLYVAPIVAWGVMGMRHYGDIAPAYFLYGDLFFFSPGGYFRDMVFKPMLLVLFSVLVGAAVMRSQRPERLLLPTIASIWVMCLLALVYFLTSSATLEQLAAAESRHFFTPLGLHANELGRMYAVAYAMLLFTWAENRESRLTLPLVATMVAVVVALVLTFSRGAFIGFIVVNILYVFWRASAKTLIWAIVIGAILAIALPGAVFMRMQYGVGVDLDTLTAGRFDQIWLPLLPELWSSPLWGEGLHSILWADAARSEHMLRVGHPHNAYFQAFMDTGLIGITLLLAYFVHLWKGFRKLGSDPALSPVLRGLFQGAAAGLAALAVANVAGSSLYPVFEQFYLWLAVGFMYGLRARRPSK